MKIQEVARLDVAVNDAFRMHLADGLKQIPHVLLHLHVTHIPIPHVLEGAGSDEQGEVVVLDHGENQIQTVLLHCDTQKGHGVRAVLRNEPSFGDLPLANRGKSLRLQSSLNCTSKGAA